MVTVKVRAADASQAAVQVVHVPAQSASVEHARVCGQKLARGKKSPGL
jgi:hypothetical protein